MWLTCLSCAGGDQMLLYSMVQLCIYCDVLRYVLFPFAGCVAFPVLRVQLRKESISITCAATRVLKIAQ